MQYKDYYAILGVKKDATEKQIKSAYRNLARKYHPDVNKEPGAAERFKEINEAHAVLSDKQKRAKYDQLGSNWQAYERMGHAPGAGRRTVFTWGNGGARAAGFDFSDFFQMFFGDMAGNAGTEPTGQFETFYTTFGDDRGSYQQGRPGHEAELEVTLEEVAFGGERQVTLGTKPITVTIPKGIREGMKLRIAEERTGLGSDVFLVVKYKPHPIYRHNGEDIESDLDVTVTKAVLGAEVDVPTLWGNVKMKLPAETQAGRVLRLRNQGLPRWRSNEKGDHLVKVRLVLPERLTDKEKQLYQELERIRSERHRA